MKASTYTLAAALAAVTVLAPVQVANAGSAEDWQLQRLRDPSEQRLRDPSEQQLRVENKGRVVIYDGLKSTEIDKALDQHFDRIEHMRFIRSQVSAPEGGYAQVDDDGC
jgi:hypothetical protein